MCALMVGDPGAYCVSWVRQELSEGIKREGSSGSSPQQAATPEGNDYCSHSRTESSSLYHKLLGLAKLSF